MRRRDFITASIAGGIAASTALSARAQSETTPNTFSLNFAPHFGMFQNSGGKALVDQLRFAADQGFRAWEDNGMKNRSPQTQEEIARTMSELDMQMGVFVATAGFGKITFANKRDEQWEAVLNDIRESVEVAKRVNATWMTVVPGNFDPGLEWDYQTVNCIELLKRCCEILEPHGLVMVLEPLNWWSDHPSLFLHKIPQAYLICRSVDSPACKILFDIYHQQIEEGNLIPNMDRAWEEIAYFQIGDNPGRREPGTGEINYANVFKHIKGKGFDGILGMEHGNSQPGKDGEAAVIRAYQTADPSHA